MGHATFQYLLDSLKAGGAILIPTSPSAAFSEVSWVPLGNKQEVLGVTSKSPPQKGSEWLCLLTCVCYIYIRLSFHSFLLWVMLRN